MILEVAASEFVDFEIGLIFNRAGGESGKQSEEGLKKRKREVRIEMEACTDIIHQ